MAQIKGVLPGITIPYALGLGRKWIRSGATFGAAGVLAVTFFCDWKDVLIYVPVLNHKFIKEE
ncbi:cytochrome b-c1 complex subunit 10-like [Dermatophagoides pteronyssinus]|uniref:Electron carrier n=1 Tax=Dermatophagoides pteronyssinus TaxID=6956 RepID=A0ABQ8J1U7_DERPT|nr:electron carrier [Dermatophagoides pteronyssinus]